jgi:DNA-binding transcriptional regulator LsrR (DeoR family)
MTEREWAEIRVKMFRRGVTFSSIAKHFGVTRQHVQNTIREGRAFRGKRIAILKEFYGRLE